MNRRSLLAMCLFAGIAASACDPPRDSAEQILADSATWKAYGEPLTDVAKGVAIRDLLLHAASFDGKTVIVRDAIVGEICQKRGWWINLHDGAATMRVTFKDDGWLLPPDSPGRPIVVEGVFRTTLDENIARRILEDDGRHEDALKLKGDQREFSLVASGLRLK